MEVSLNKLEEGNFESTDFWLREEITIKNIKDFLMFLSKEYEEHSEQFLDIRKKLLRKNRAVLSLIITFSRDVDKNNETLVLLLKKLIQAIMDNPKLFRK